MKKTLVLAIMDGVGAAPPGPGNAVTKAHTPNLDKLWPQYPRTYLQASGTNVGLPHGVDGNSEVGHLSIGAGRVIMQNLPRIDNAISQGHFFDNPKLIKAIEQAKYFHSNLHIVGLIGSGEVHSSIRHLFAVLRLSKLNGLQPDQVKLHLFTDGRDSPPNGAVNVLEQIDAEIDRFGVGQIVSLIGRYYAMDRDLHWERTQKAVDLITKSKGRIFNNWREALEYNYSLNQTDEFLEPVLIKTNVSNAKPLTDKDTMIMINFRPDRARQFTEAFAKEEFSKFKVDLKPAYFVSMTEYGQNFPLNVAFKQELIGKTLGEVISNAGMNQLRIAESEKYAHVTYFFNGGVEKLLKGEDRVEVPSPRDVANYKDRSEMMTPKIAEITCQKIITGNYDFILVNFANADMVAHSGDFDATVSAVQSVDEAVGMIHSAVKQVGGILIVTADHGNAEELKNVLSKEVDTKHSTNPVPFLVAKEGLPSLELGVGALKDIAPTILDLLDLEVPTEMTGRNLLEGVN